LDDFNAFFNSHFNEDEADTIAGIVLHQFSHLPKTGEKITINDFEFKVTAADNRRIQTLRVTIPKTHVINNKPTD